MFVPKFFFLSLFVNCLKSDDNLIQQIDEKARQLFAFGDPNNKMPEIPAKIEDLCKIFKEAIVDPFVANEFAFPFTNNKRNRVLALEAIKSVAKVEICVAAKEKGKDIIPLVKEMNTKLDKLAPIRKNLMNTLADAVKSDSKITKSQFACLTYKYYDQTLEHLSQELKKLFTIKLKPWLKISDSFKKDKICEWIPDNKANKNKYQSFELMYFEAAKNIYNRNE